ncbi:uncharacterized protein MELLADRAFT_92162 [Melampsora larici-populina 98AG31]|uniref:Uncharacterized protein n=1 Tax=Melampsora larici-populina (strain 98AG31 / pathotype 3-4-7) TaxID=747676 RepID=F4S1Q8_MELLP|nr:uncharacterized protein MELLADRAFT_92162 [Melampsora larici-populina 98AG31]EGG01461.1 hypothetical protein MELLADRAFT_92162 [Melampsora larici-populina 98AG31]
MEGSSADPGTNSGGTNSGPAVPERDPIMDQLDNHPEEEPGLNFEQAVAVQIAKEREAKRRQQQRKTDAEEMRARKEPRDSVKLVGMTSAVQEWARALLGLPRQSSTRTSPNISAAVLLARHLPDEPTPEEVEQWANYSDTRTKYLDVNIQQKMDKRFKNNPSANESVKHQMRIMVSKEAVLMFNQAFPPPKFISRVAHATASITTYNATRLGCAEAKFAGCGFSRITFQWTSPPKTPWNMAMLDNLITSWLDCYNARGVPSGFPIDSSLNIPLETREILSRWVSNKRRVFRDEAKERKLVSTEGGSDKLVRQKLTEREKTALKAIRKKLCEKRAAAVEPYFRHFTGPLKVLLNSQEVHSETEMDPEKPGKFWKVKLNWRTPQLDELIKLADDAAPKRESTKKQKDRLKEFFQSRGEYSPNVPDPEDQLPPKTLPRCLIKPEILTEGIDEITIDSLELSDTTLLCGESIHNCDYRFRTMASTSQNSAPAWPNGAAPKGRKAKNRSFAKILPKSNSPTCKSFAEFTRYLLGHTRNHPHFPNPPTDEQLMSLTPLTQEGILSDTSVFVNYSSDNHPNPLDWSVFKALLHTDMANHQIEGPFTFGWEAQGGEDAAWNQVMILFTVKHWMFARRASAFQKFGLDVEWEKEVIYIGIVTRWVIGRIEDWKNEFASPEKIAQRERSRKRRDLFIYRKSTVKRFLKDFIDLLPEAACCSDTEDDSLGQQRSIQPEWRSAKYGEWLHKIDVLSYNHQATVKLRTEAARRFDTRREAGNKINPLAKVCGNLPANCYDSGFLRECGDLEKLRLGVTNNHTRLDDALQAIARLL